MSDVKKLDEEVLTNVTGGGWGYNLIHDEKKYNSADISTEWTLNPFCKDKFKYYEPGYGTMYIDDETAASIVFFREQHKDWHVDIRTAKKYRQEHQAEFNKFLKSV